MSRRARIALVGGGIVALVLVLGQVLVPGRAPEPAAGGARGAAAPAPTEPGGLMPTPSAPMASSGRSRDAEGANEAAADYARSYGDLVALDEQSAVAAKRAMAASASADRLVAAMRERLAALRRVWPVGAISYRVAPVAVRVRMHGPGAADAAVWYVGVIAGQGLPTYEEWVTQSYRLVWERDDWRIAEESESAGPRPEPGRQAPASASELEARLAGFEAPR